MENLGEIVEFAEESETRSEEGILRSLRTCVQKHVRVQIPKIQKTNETNGGIRMEFGTKTNEFGEQRRWAAAV